MQHVTTSFYHDQWIYYIIFVIIIAQLVGCTTKMATDIPSLKLEDFEFLEAGIDFQSIVDKVGKPNRDIGSGLYLYQYDLSDGQKITLQFISLNNLSGAWVEKANGTRIILIP